VTVSLRSERPLNSIVLINIGGNAGRIDSLLSPLLDVRDASVADTLSSAGRTALHDFRFATAPVEGQVSLQFTAPVWRYSYADREFVFIARAGEEPGLQVAAPADMDMTLPGNVVVTGTPAGTVLSSIGIGREVAGPITAGDKTAASDSVAVDWTDQGSAQQREFALFLSGVVAGALAAIVMETVFKAIVAD
jgi:hypothetical protein